MDQKPRLWTGDFALLLGVNFLAFVCCQALNNGTPLYVANLGGATVFSGALILEFSCMAAVARLASGRIIDKRSRKAVMVAGAALLLAGTVLCLPFPGLEAQLVMRALQGVGFGCVTTAASTAAADVLPAARLGEGIGYYGLGQSLGMVVGPSYGVLLCSLMYQESLFLGVTAVAAVLVLCVAACGYEKHVARLPQTCAYRRRVEQQAADARPGADGAKGPQGEAPARGFLASLFERSALVGAAPMLVICLAFAIPTSYTALYVPSIGLENAGLFFVFGALSMTACRLFGGRAIDALAPRVLYLFAVACGVGMFALLLAASSQAMLYAAGILFGFSMGMAFPLLNSVAVKNTAPERWGAANALFYLMNDLGVGIGAVVWGLVIDMAGFAPVMVGGGVLMAASFAVALLSFSRATTA